MKKISLRMLMLAVVIVLSNCEIKVKDANAKKEKGYNTYSIDNRALTVTIYKKDGIEYRIFTHNQNFYSGIAVVNHTKELLEVELLRKQLGK